MKQVTYFQIPKAPYLYGTLPTELGMIQSLGEKERMMLFASYSYK